MIYPDEIMDLDISVIRISSIILKKMNKDRIVKYPELLNYLIKKEGENVRFVFLSCVMFLYSLGKIEYYLKTDSLEVKNEIE